MQLSVLCAGDKPAREIIRRAVFGEAAGYDNFLLADERFFLEPMQLLAASAGGTARIGLGPCVLDPYTTHPALIARSISTLDQVSGGRAILVLGAGKSGFRELGIERAKSAARLREAVLLIKELFAKGEADFHGELITFDSGRMNLPMRPDLAVWVATEGRLTLEMAGALADAVMVSSVATPERVASAIASVARGAAKAGRARPPIHVRLDAATHEDGAVARDGVRFIVLRHLIANMDKPEFVEEHGLEPAFIESLRALDYKGFSRDGARIMKFIHLVPDHLLTPFVLAGSLAEVGAQARNLAAAIEGITVYPHPVAGQDWATAAGMLAAAAREG